MLFIYIGDIYTDLRMTLQDHMNGMRHGSSNIIKC